MAALFRDDPLAVLAERSTWVLPWEDGDGRNQGADAYCASLTSEGDAHRTETGRNLASARGARANRLGCTGRIEMTIDEYQAVRPRNGNGSSSSALGRRPARGRRYRRRTALG